MKYTFAFYKIGLRPYFGNSCKFYPTCSSYSHEAISSRGLFIGLFLSAKRLLRCHPFCEGGFDPVPKSREVLNGR